MTRKRKTPLSRTDFSELVGEVLDSTGLTQAGLAQALGVSQQSVSLWRRQTTEPSALYQVTLFTIKRLANVLTAPIDPGDGYDPVPLPTELWRPVFTPRGDFQLPARIHSRIDTVGRVAPIVLDGSQLSERLLAYALVAESGTPADAVLWIDPVELAENFEDAGLPDHLEGAWRAALEEWGLM